MYYFAYALNLNRSQMTQRCPDMKPKLTAALPNYRLIFSGWSRHLKGGVATIKHQTGEKVMGFIYEISPSDLKRLDEYEGYPKICDRIKVTVWTDTGDPIAAETYVMINQGQETAPSQEYLSIIRQGYKDWDIE